MRHVVLPCLEAPGFGVEISGLSGWVALLGAT